MRSAYKFRKDATTELFKNEIFGVAQCISQDSISLYHGVKSDILKRLPTVLKPTSMQCDSSLTIDLSGIINAKANMNFTTFKELADYLYSYILSIRNDSERCDVVCDRYFHDSLKEGVRHDRGSGTKINFDENSKFPTAFSQDFLKNSENKEKLNKFLAQKFIKLHEHKSQIFVVTFEDTILSNRIDYMNDTTINNCTAEEADPRLKNIMVKTVDTDVLILAIAYCGKLISHSIDTFFVEFGSGSHTKYFNVVELFQFLGELRSTALPFFHSFSGCDTTSSF